MMRTGFLFVLLLTFKLAQAQVRGVVRSAVDSTLQKSDARAIIERAIALKKENDIRQRLNAFRFKSYQKLTLTAPADSVQAIADTLVRHKLFGKRVRIDSSQIKIRRLLEKQHFFLAEKFSTFEYDGHVMKETINGLRMSGFEEPLYELVGLHFQSFSLYDPTFQLLESRYRSPLSISGMRIYDYELLDTLMIDHRQVFAVRFRDRRSRESGSPDGVLLIDVENFALCGWEVRASGLVIATADVKMQWNADGFWHPVQRSFTVRKGSGRDNIQILGETIRFDASDNRRKLASDHTQLTLVSRYRDFTFNSPIKIRRAGVAIEVHSHALKQSDSVWNQVRGSTLDEKEVATYQANDSLVAARKIDKKLRFGRKIINGYIPLGPVDADIRHLISYNNFEGFRLGIGGVTNSAFSDLLRLDGYTAYGTKDGKWKYHLGSALRLGQFSNTWIGVAYTDDIREIGSTSFATDKRIFKLYDPRPFNITTFYRYEQAKVYLETRILPKTESIWQLSRSFITPLFPYRYVSGTTTFESFTFFSASVAVQWNPFSDFMQTPTGRFETEKRFPKFALQITQTQEGIAGGDFTFTKIDVRAEYEKSFLDGQKTSFLLQGGYALGDVPLTHLYSTSPNHLNRDALLQRITFAGKNSFETMYFNEFFSNRFVSLQFKHQLRALRLFSKVKPVPVFVTRMVWGGLHNRERHLGLDFKTLEDGYFESGVEMNRIFKGFGFSGFYRYGPYQLPRFDQNISLKVSFSLNLGI